jgi:hypothetical protein
MDKRKNEIVRLREMQSIRTTFNITKEGKEALDYLSEEYGLKPKEVFDELFNDDNRLLDAYKNIEKEFDTKVSNKVKKTYVISKKALRWLNKTSKEKHISRDLLVAIALSGYVQILLRKIGERANKEGKAIEIINKFNEVFNKTTQQLVDLFGEDDSIIEGWYEGACEFGLWEIFSSKEFFDKLYAKHGEKQ